MDLGDQRRSDGGERRWVKKQRYGLPLIRCEVSIVGKSCDGLYQRNATVDLGGNITYLGCPAKQCFEMVLLFLGERVGVVEKDYVV